jgi:hypothetical protein
MFVSMDSSMIAYYTEVYGSPQPAYSLSGVQVGWLFGE